MIQSALGLKNAGLNIFNDCVKIKLISLLLFYQEHIREFTD